jgi:SAM-dependent methyltransferase
MSETRISSFASDAILAGYAKSRPPVHRRVIRLVQEALGRTFRRALDVGCGAGLSTAALEGFAARRIGTEPVRGMIAPAVAPGALFCEGAAEALPFGDGAFDLLAAAGSLNYVDLGRFWPEARRVLAPGGVLVVYDFSAGRWFADGDAGLERWFADFVARFPYPAGAAVPLDPDILGRIAEGFRVTAASEFRMPLRLSADFYFEYMLTETNAVPHEAARAWCAETLPPVWADREEADVVFAGYFACLAPVGDV